MTVGATGYFMPAEAYWGKSPGAYEQALQGHASQTAKYLAMMDQYSAGLESQEKMFQQKMDQQESQFGRTFGWEQERFAEELEWQKELAQSQLSMREYEIRSQERTALSGQRVQSQAYAAQHSLGMGQLDLARQQQAYREKSFDTIYDVYSQMGTPGQTQGTAKTEAPFTSVDQINRYYDAGAFSGAGWLSEMQEAYKVSSNT